MSKAFYQVESLRFYDEDEIEIREMIVQRLAGVVKRTLVAVNPAWKINRVEGPILTPRQFVGAAYGEDDIFFTQVEKLNDKLVLRPETTPSTYAFIRSDLHTNHKDELNAKRLPVCYWQIGKSFRVEASDGATAAKLRFNEFYQQEFQCVYSKGTMADYRLHLITAVSEEIRRFLQVESRVIDSDRLPSYSESTLDIEVPFNGTWKEVASCSIRTDLADNVLVAEIAVGIDRLVEIYSSKR